MEGGNQTVLQPQGVAGPRQQVARAAALMLRLGCPRGWCPARDPTRPSRQSESGTDPARSPQYLTAVCVECHDQREGDNQPRSPAATLEGRSEAARKRAR